MPEVGFSTEVIKAAQAARLARKEWGQSRTLEEVIDRFDLEYVGEGAECVVVGGKKGVSSSGDENLVAAFTYEDRPAAMMKSLFYAQRVMATLFPHNFPKFYAAFGEHPEIKKGENLTGTLRQRLEIDEDQEMKYPFREVKKTVEKLKLPFGFDEYFMNFWIGKDGGQYYVDTVIVSVFADRLEQGRQKLQEYMEEKGYSEKEKRIVEKAMQRLIELAIMP